MCRHRSEKAAAGASAHLLILFAAPLSQNLELPALPAWVDVTLLPIAGCFSEPKRRGSFHHSSSLVCVCRFSCVIHETKRIWSSLAVYQASVTLYLFCWDPRSWSGSKPFWPQRCSSAHYLETAFNNTPGVNDWWFPVAQVLIQALPSASFFILPPKKKAKYHASLDYAL